MESKSGHAASPSSTRERERERERVEGSKGTTQPLRKVNTDALLVFRRSSTTSNTVANKENDGKVLRRQ
jgi:hypothetical protein